MAFQKILALNGPLPIKASFNSPVIGAVDFIITGTAWTSVSPGPIGITVTIDGAPIANSLMFANLKSDHMTLPTALGSITLSTIGPHVVEILQANSNTTTDFNDAFTVTIQF
jgi:hypothetical protein